MTTILILTCPPDHPVMFSRYLASDSAETIDGILSGVKEEVDSESDAPPSTSVALNSRQEWSAQWQKDGSGMMSSK